jgi:N-acetylneuraminic acid mutarotase
VSQIATLARPLTHAAAVVLGGVVYVIGGRGSVQGTQTTQILALHPASGRVTPGGTLPLALSDSGAAVLGAAIIVVGGREAGGTVSDRIYALRPKASTP